MSTTLDDAVRLTHARLTLPESIEREVAVLATAQLFDDAIDRFTDGAEGLFASEIVPLLKMTRALGGDWTRITAAAAGYLRTFADNVEALELPPAEG